MDPRDELDTLRRERRLAELEAKASGVEFGDIAPPPPAAPPLLDPGIDYENEIGDMKFRAALSFMKTPRQREFYLNKTLGEGNWGQDNAGNTIVHPAGLSRIGIKADKPRPIDKVMPTKADLADLAVHVPPVLGGIGGSMAATGVGAVPGLALAGGGAALGQALSEAGKYISGNPPTGKEALQSIIEEGLGGALGEGTFRVAKGVGNTLLNPAAKLMTPERTGLMDEAMKRGFRPYPGQVTGSSLQQRIEGVTRRIFGTANEAVNIPKTLESLENLKKWAGPAVDQETVGRTAAENLISARREFGKQAHQWYEELDMMIPTARLRKEAQKMLNSKTQTIDGKIITLDQPTQSFLTDLTKLPEEIPVANMHSLRSTLRNKGQIKTLAPTLESMEFRLLGDAADSTFEHAATRYGNTAKVARMREIDAAYKEGIKKFDIPFLGNITKDKKFASSIDPDQVFEYAIQNKHSVRAREFLENLPESTKAMVRRSLADKVTARVFREAEDPFSTILSGSDFKLALNEVGVDTLHTVMGKEWTQEAYKLADIIKMVTSGNKESGGLVVANAILNPLKHMGELAGYKLLSQAMTNKAFLKWMTTGMANPQSAAGKAALKSIEHTMRALAQTGPATVEEGVSAITSE